MVVNDGSSLPLFNKVTLGNTFVVVVFTLIITVAKSEVTFLF